MLTYNKLAWLATNLVQLFTWYVLLDKKKNVGDGKRRCCVRGKWKNRCVANVRKTTGWEGLWMWVVLRIIRSCYVLHRKQMHCQYLMLIFMFCVFFYFFFLLKRDREMRMNSGGSLGMGGKLNLNWVSLSRHTVLSNVIYQEGLTTSPMEMQIWSIISLWWFFQCCRYTFINSSHYAPFAKLCDWAQSNLICECHIQSY